MLLFSSCLSSWFVLYCLDPESRVILRSPEEEAGPDRYINANYIRVRASHCCLKLSQVTCGSLKVFLSFQETERCPLSGGHIEKLYVDMIESFLLSLGVLLLVKIVDFQKKFCIVVDFIDYIYIFI